MNADAAAAVTVASNKRAFFFNSALAFASAELLTATLHEAGHGVVAQALGFAPRIYAFYEDNPTGNVQQTVAILAAGPVISLLLGLVFLAWYRQGSARYRFGRLLLFWLAWLGIMEFVNYVIVTPWLSAGDTAQIANLFGWSLWPRYAVAAAGVGLLFRLARPAAATMFAVAPRDIRLETGAERRRFIMIGFYLPLIAGTLLTAAAGIGGRPANVALGLLATFGNIDLVALTLYAAQDVAVVARGSEGVIRIEPAAIVLYLASVAFYVIVLARGVPV